MTVGKISALVLLTIYITIVESCRISTPVAYCDAICGLTTKLAKQRVRDLHFLGARLDFKCVENIKSLKVRDNEK